MSLDLRLAACLFGHVDTHDFDARMTWPALSRSRRSSAPRVPEALRRQRRTPAADALLAPARPVSR